MKFLCLLIALYGLLIAMISCGPNGSSTEAPVVTEAPTETPEEPVKIPEAPTSEPKPDEPSGEPAPSEPTAPEVVDVIVPDELPELDPVIVTVPEPVDPSEGTDALPEQTVAVVVRVEGTVAQVDRITRLSKVVQKIINSDKFKQRVLGATYKGELRFYDTKKTNEEVYQALMDGNELKTGNDGIWNMEIGLKKATCSTLGWTYPSVKMFWFNTCTFSTRPDSGITGTMCHEYTHKLGFGHSVSYTSSRPYSVPYAIGTICAELYPEFK